MGSAAEPPKTEHELVALFDPLYQRFEQPISDGKLLAHYTSIKVMESVLQTSEIWFSNPLFMNDMQEMRSGLQEGMRFFANKEPLLRAGGGSEKRADILQQLYFHFFKHFDEQQAFDTYVFCLSEHDASDNDGLLSMWRGYGQHGNGAALVFDPSKLTQVPSSPLIFGKVSYVTNETRSAQVDALMNEWAALTERLALPDDKLHLAAYVAFSLIKMHALMTKHAGFSEENEWRVVYYPERDGVGALKPFLQYHIGERGVEPKLKYKIGHLAGVSAPDLALERILNRIILGPSLSSPLAKRSVERMLEIIGKPEFKGLLQTSGIPLRPTSGTSF
jgi:hypothetical protein